MACSKPVLILISSIVIALLRNTTCQIPKEACSYYSKPGDISIGAVFQMRRNQPTPCQGGVSALGLLYSEALIYAVEKLNVRMDILRNITLGYEIRDSCTSEEVAMWSAMSLFTDQCQMYNVTPKIVGLIAGGSTATSIFVAKVANLYKVPMISWAATSDELSDKTRFPYFLRSVPPDRLQVGAIIDILLKYNWKYVSLVYSEDTYGINGARSFKSLSEINGICIARSVSTQVRASDTEVLTLIEKQNEVPKAKVIVVFANGNIGEKLVSELGQRNKLHNLTFIWSDGWGFNIKQSEYVESLLGSLLVKPKRTIDDEFSSYFDNFDPRTDAKTVWAKEFWTNWQKRFNCTHISKCPYSRLGLSSFGAYITLCVDVFENALDSLLSQLQMTYDDTESLVKNITGQMVLTHLLHVHFNTSNGIFRFDKLGDSLGSYDILNLQTSHGRIDLVNVGSWMLKGVRKLYKSIM